MGPKGSRLGLRRSDARQDRSRTRGLWDRWASVIRSPVLPYAATAHCLFPCGGNLARAN